MSAPTTINAKMCQEIHQELLSNGVNTTTNTMEIVSIIGGIDTIISQYLAATVSNENMLLINDEQLQKIYRILATKETNGLLSNNSDELVYHFNKDDTYLHCLFQEYGDMIVHNFIYNKSFVYPMFILVNVGFLQFFREYISDLYIIVPAFVMWTIVIPWMCLLLLSVNIKALKMILKSFDFHFKVLYMALYLVTRFVYIHYISDIIDNDRRNVWWFTYDILYSLSRLFVILIWSCLDALQLPLYMKIYLGLLISIAYSLNALVTSLYAQSNGDDSIIHINQSMSISLISYNESSIRIVAIFLWKQTILSILKKNRCILIKYSPFITWFDAKSLQIQMENEVDMHNNIGKANENHQANGQLDNHTIELSNLQTNYERDASQSTHL